MSKGWIGVDFDGTLAYYTSWEEQENNLGAPIPAMLDRVKQWIADGQEVRIFTARVVYDGQKELILDWLKANGLPELGITNVKDSHMIALWDDRCVQVVKNTGEPVV